MRQAANTGTQPKDAIDSRPIALQKPPSSAWKAEFARMAAEAGLSTTEYLDAFAILEQFWSDHVVLPEEVGRILQS